jgi:hypothetical protein
MRLHHREMHLRDASIAPDDPEILPRDREIYLSRRLLSLPAVERERLRE